MSYHVRQKQKLSGIAEGEAARASLPVSPHSQTAIQPLIDDVLQSSGQPLDEDTRAYMEPRLGHNLGNVRVHSDQQAAESTEAVNALAYTVGNNVVFKAGHYTPQTSEGRQLLAHELTHVVQQSAGQVEGSSLGNGLMISDPSDSYEQAAEATARRVMSSDSEAMPSLALPPLAHTASPALTIQRQADPSQNQQSGGLTFDTVTITSQPGQYATRAVEALHNASNRAKINALQYGLQVQFACDAFKNYADPKIKDLEGRLTAGKLAGALLEKGLAAIPIPGLGAITNELGKKIAEKAADFIKDKIAKAAGEKVSEDDNVAALKAAVQSIAQGAQDAATGIQEAVGSQLDPVVNSIIQKTNQNETLTDQEQDFVAQFYMAPEDAVDQALETFCGIPTGASAKATQIRLYRSFVESFEEMDIWANATFEEQIEMTTDQAYGVWDKSLEGRANQAADAATEARKKALGVQ